MMMMMMMIIIIIIINVVPVAVQPAYSLSLFLSTFLVSKFPKVLQQGQRYFFVCCKTQEQ